ncbi:hypothetical protein BHE74_00044844 [Ensete ventricosum]|nr:hypothetical protein GW17_00061158 [Ensete ventricosum]RWW49040.1 hypothetical protein BHE74_00044844 [Ensete ventricosum]RZS26805.1 hypothetical protein BHM03_00060202 [Ensete ventricosum]
MPTEGDTNVDVRGGDLRLAPFGAGRRVCPGKNLGLAIVGLWVARLVHDFEWGPAECLPVDLDEVLKLSLEMKTLLTAVATPKENVRERACGSFPGLSGYAKYGNVGGPTPRMTCSLARTYIKP